MTALRLSVVAAAVALAATAVRAQDAGRASAQPPALRVAADDGLYQALGRRANIERFTHDFYDRLLQDGRLAPYFDGVRASYLKQVLTDYFCVAAGGPCTYDGVSMKDSHAHLGIDRAAFNATVEHLQSAMAAADVPFRTQNQLLARLAFSHRDIITK